MKLNLALYLCLPLTLSLSLSIFLLYLSISPSLFLSLSLSISLSLSLSLSLHLSLSLSLFLHLSLSLSLSLPLYLFPQGERDGSVWDRRELQTYMREGTASLIILSYLILYYIIFILSRSLKGRKAIVLNVSVEVYIVKTFSLSVLPILITHIFTSLLSLSAIHSSSLASPTVFLIYSTPFFFSLLFSLLVFFSTSV